MVEWLNTNQGAVMAVLTVVYVVATVLMAWLMRRNLSLLSQLEQRRSRPYVIFDLVAKDHVVRAVVRNSGLAAANGVVLRVTPPLVRDGRESPLINHEIAYLLPGREFSDFVDSGPAFFERYPEARFQGEVTYRDADGASYREPFTIDLAFQADLQYVSEKNIGRELEKLAKHVEGIARSVSRRPEV